MASENIRRPPNPDRVCKQCIQLGMTMTGVHVSRFMIADMHSGGWTWGADGMLLVTVPDPEADVQEIDAGAEQEDEEALMHLLVFFFDVKFTSFHVKDRNPLALGGTASYTLEPDAIFDVIVDNVYPATEPEDVKAGEDYTNLVDILTKCSWFMLSRPDTEAKNTKEAFTLDQRVGKKLSFTPSSGKQGFFTRKDRATGRKRSTLVRMMELTFDVMMAAFMNGQKLIDRLGRWVPA